MSDDRTVHGKRIKTTHTQYQLSYGMMLGIWTTAQFVPTKPRPSMDDFKDKQVRFFEVNGNPELNLPPLDMKHPFSFRVRQAQAQTDTDTDTGTDIGLDCLQGVLLLLMV